MNEPCRHTERAELLLEQLMQLCDTYVPAIFTINHPFTHELAQFVEFTPFENMMAKLRRDVTDLCYWWDTENE